MKKNLQLLFSLVALMCFAVGAWAQEKPTAPASPAYAKLSTDGSTPQYLYNVEAKGFYVGANDWGTRASISADKGYAVKITANGDTYTLETQLPNGNWNSADCQAVDQIWVDGGGRGGDGLWLVTEGSGNTFKLSNSNVADGGYLAVVPSKNDTRLYLSTEADAQDVWAVVSEEAYNQYVEAYAEYLAALDEYNKQNYQPGDNIVSLAPATWEGQTGTFGNGVERYSGAGSLPVGDVLTQTLTDLKNGVYTVTLQLGASYTSGRGFECPTGDNLSVAFAQDETANLPVVDRGWINDGEYDVIEFTVNVTDGTLTYGIKNIADAGNWYVAGVTSLVFVEAAKGDDNLTSEMFHEWDAEGNITGSVPGIHFTNKIGEEVWQGAVVYGNSRVEENAYADLTEYEKMILTVESGTPRLVFNVKGATEKIEIKGEGEYATIDGKTWTIDLAKMTKNEGFAHLNVIKEAKWTGTVTVSSIVLKKAETLEETYARALKTIQNGNYYRVYAEVEGANYYLKADGTLTADVENAYNFEFKAVENSNAEYGTGWNLGCRFTNPTLSNGSTGDIVNIGGIRVDSKNDRDDFERQVFFLNNEGEYAVRSTNGKGENWGANTYWTVLTEGELPEAGHALEPNYVWQLEDVTAEVIIVVAQDALAAAQAVVDAKAGVGTKAFEISEEAYNAYAAAVAAAAEVINAEGATAEALAQAVANLKAAKEAYAAAPLNAPIDGQAYILSLTTTEGTYPISITADGIKIAEEGTDVYFVAQENGKYAISNGTEYVNYEGSNGWTMIASSEPYGWTIAAVEGGYTLTGNNGRFLGTNTSDGAAAGSPCYGDKQSSNGFYIWSIEEKSLLAEGDYLIKNVATGKYLGGANSWGTQASLVDNGRIFTVAKIGNGKYTLDSHTYNNATSHYLGDAGYVDSGAAELTLTKVENGLAIGVSATAFYGAPAEGTALVYDLGADDANAAWEFIPVADAVAALEDGTETDATFLFKDASVSRNLYNASFENVWEGDAFSKGGANENQNAEKWGGNSQEFDVHQTITLPNGTYRITANGYYRYNNTNDNTNDVAIAAHADGTEVIYSYLYANDEQVALKSIADDEAAEALEKLPFSQGDASVAFGQGLYLNTLTVEVTDGQLTIGVKKTEHIGCDWTVWDNFTITKIEKKPEVAFKDTPLTQDMFKTWDGFDASATVVGEHPYWDATEIGTTAGAGTTIYGSGNVTNTDYADVTGANVLRIEGEPGLQLRVLFNRQADNSLVELNPTIGDNGYVDVDLTSYEYVHINAIKLGWGSPSGAVTALILNPTNGEESSELEQTIDVEREIAQGYAAQVESVDFTEALAYLGVESIEDCTLSVVNPDGTQISEYAAYDGWFNGEGAAETWGANTKVCVKFFQALENGTFEICDMNGADEVGATYTVKWALTANGKTAIYTINVTFVGASEYKPEIVKTIEIEGYDLAGVAYRDASHPTFDVAEVTTALGINDISEADTYIVNVTDGNFVVNSTDGWRDANGNASPWGTEKGYCLKLNDPASGEFDYNGAFDDTYQVGDTHVAQWGIVANEKAVVLKVTIKFVSEIPAAAGDATDISGVDANSTIKNGKVLENNKVVIYRNGVKYNVTGTVIK